MIPPEALQAFKEAYFKEFGIEVDDAKALDLAQSLLNMYRVIYRPLPDLKNNNASSEIQESDWQNNNGKEN